MMQAAVLQRLVGRQAGQLSPKACLMFQSLSDAARAAFAAGPGRPRDTRMFGY